jgi:hypothetical protein
MKKFNLILILIFSCQLGIAQTKDQKPSKSESLFFQDYSLSGRMKKNSYINTSIDVKALDYTKILEELSEEKKFDFSKKPLIVKNFEIKGLNDKINLEIIEGIHIEIKADIFSFSTFKNQEEKEDALINNKPNQKIGLVIYVEKKGKNKYLSDDEMNLVIEFLKSI